ncbi:MAG: hypothetical protein JXA18_02105 [Chitinispirillaceae bacterium]|nr:hypothetical protein [Chitinispirillaceae bacterium]
MKCLKILLFTLTLSVAVYAQLDTSSQHFYLYIYFINREQELGARLAFSTDAVTWQKYDDGNPVIAPEIAKGEVPLMRDPNVLYDSSTGVFHLIWTTAWNQDNIGYATSKDLLHWSEQIMIPVGQRIKGCACCWAPEFFYDDLKDSIMVYWSTERGTIGKEAFYCMTRDFIHYTAPQVYFAPKNKDGEVYTVIDETILKVADNKYYMFFKDEREPMIAQKVSKNIHFVFGPTPQGPWWEGPWDMVSTPISVPGNEGPSAIIMGDEVRVYFDPYNNTESTDRTAVARLADFLGEGPPPDAAWSKGPVMKTGTGSDNFLVSHGSVSRIPRAKVMQVLYGIPDPTVYPETWTHPQQSEIVVEEIVADTSDTGSIDYPLGKQNCGLGSGVGLAFFPPFVFKAMAMRRRRKRRRGDA